jgi:hypothetical protein
MDVEATAHVVMGILPEPTRLGTRTPAGHCGAEVERCPRAAGCWGGNAGHGSGERGPQRNPKSRKWVLGSCSALPSAHL